MPGQGTTQTCKTRKAQDAWPRAAVTSYHALDSLQHQRHILSQLRGSAGPLPHRAPRRVLLAASSCRGLRCSLAPGHNTPAVSAFTAFSLLCLCVALSVSQKDTGH